MKILLIGIAVVIFGKAASSFLYNGTSTYLELRRGLPIELIFYDVAEKNGTDPETDKPVIKRFLGKILGSASVSPNATSVNGKSVEISSGLVKNTLTVKFPGQTENKPASNVSVESLTLNMEFIIDNNSNRWTLTAMQTVYKAKLGGGKSVSNTDAILATPRPGYTHNKADIAYTKGYTTGAGKFLAWTCSDQQYISNLTNKKTGDVAVGVRFRELRMQPFDGTTNSKRSAPFRFGYAWDCDPIISVPLWDFILIGIFFIMILYWSISMLSAIKTPDRFDDPKGRPLTVPLQD